MKGGGRGTILAEAILISVGLMAFSFFIQFKFPVRLIAFAALLLSAIIISWNIRSLSDLKKIIGEFISLRNTLLNIFFGIVIGIVFVLMYRWHLDLTLFPKSIHLFIFSAAIIGCNEELVFRGFLQGQIKIINGPFSILFSTISHTGYKCCLFLSPAITSNIDVGFLALWTFVAGILFGTIRDLSKSLIPSLSAHALFDILVYAEYCSPPWWVW